MSIGCLNSICRLAVLMMIALAFASPKAPAAGIVVDHTNTDLAAIPDASLPAASALRVMVRRASVGGNISGGLSQIQTAASKYNRTNWTFLLREGNPNPGWKAKIDDLDSYTMAHLNEYDVFSQKFCYVDHAADWAYYRDHMEQLEAAHPDKKFIWWTIPLEKVAARANRQTFNETVRTYCRANKKILFDIADIECHAPDGTKITSNGIEMLYPDYGSDNEGHLNTTGSDRVAKGFWNLMVQVAGQPVPVKLVSFEAQ